MRLQVWFGAWWLLLTLAWWAVAISGGSAEQVMQAGLGWQLRQNALYLSGLWAIGMMSLAMVLSMRQQWMERLLGGMDQLYRLHRWTGIAATIASVVHWGAKESSSLIKSISGTEGKPARELVLSWAVDMRGVAKDVGEWAFYALLLMVVVTLWQRLVPYRPWSKLHRVMPVFYLLLIFHSVALMPQSFWQAPVGALIAGFMLLGSVAAVWSLSGQVGRGHRYQVKVHSVQVLPDVTHQHGLVALDCAMPSNWPGHKAGQFVFVMFDDKEGAHPFTIASAQGQCGKTAQGQELIRLLIKPLGDYTRLLAQHIQPGQRMRIEGPYGQFDGQGHIKKQQIWIAAGIGVTPFLALLQARQSDNEKAAAQLQSAYLHYCTHDAAHDPVLTQLHSLCVQAQPRVVLQVHDSAQGQRLQPQDLVVHGAQLDIWCCGALSLGQAIQKVAASQPGWSLHQEAFQMR